jgi:hypothetical protein
MVLRTSVGPVIMPRKAAGKWASIRKVAVEGVQEVVQTLFAAFVLARQAAKRLHVTATIGLLPYVAFRYVRAPRRLARGRIRDIALKHQLPLTSISTKGAIRTQNSGSLPRRLGYCGVRHRAD